MKKKKTVRKKRKEAKSGEFLVSSKVKNLEDVFKTERPVRFGRHFPCTGFGG